MHTPTFLSWVSLGLLLSAQPSFSAKILITNDDGWAVAQVRAQYDALVAAGHDVVLSCPAVNKSGSGSSSATPVKLSTPCQFNTCAQGSPAIGSDPSSPRLNYVNAYPVDAAKYGIRTLSPQYFGSPPDLVISGTNVGSNLGSTVLISGTVGAAAAAALEGVPSIAFSGSSGSQSSYTILTTSPNSSASTTARIYTNLVQKLAQAYLSSSAPGVPRGVSVNVNFASTSNCTSASAYKFVFTRVFSAKSTDGADVATCGKTRLTDEGTVVKSGCIATVSAFNATTKGDVDAATQKFVLDKVSSILTCL